MNYLTSDEASRIIDVARTHDSVHALALSLAYAHGLRVSELLSLTPRDIVDGVIVVKRKKHSLRTEQPVCRVTLVALAEHCADVTKRLGPTAKLFDWSRQWHDIIIKRYAIEANVHPGKAHSHVFKHSTAMRIWEATRNLGAIQKYLGHKSASSTLIYLAEDDKRMAADAMAKVFENKT
jgi:integrase/recombinase XerD